MVNLVGEKVVLRAIEPNDLDFLYTTENTSNLWEVSDTVTPFSKYILEQYINESHRDIYDAKQLRLAICLQNDVLIGFIDLFEFNPQHLRAGVGLVITSKTHRGKGYAKDALHVFIKYCFDILNLHQLYCDIHEENTSSVQLFESCGFEKSGIKKDWNFKNGVYKSVLMFQLIKS